jgi:hypothetical protein
MDIAPVQLRQGEAFLAPQILHHDAHDAARKV